MTAFASTEDLGEKKVSFEQIGAGLYAYTAEGDPNSGVIIGDDGVMVIDAQATPTMADDVIARVACRPRCDVGLVQRTARLRKERGASKGE